MGWRNAQNYQYRPNAPLVSPQSGVPQRDGIDLILALYNRTGGGTGTPNQVAPDNVTATGTSLSTATELQFDWNTINPVSAGSGVRIPIATMVPGADIVILNSGSSTLKVYPPTTDIQIDALGNGQPYSLSAGSQQTFKCWSATQLRSGA